jgi:hypothetical protein
VCINDEGYTEVSMNDFIFILTCLLAQFREHQVSIEGVTDSILGKDIISPLQLISDIESNGHSSFTSDLGYSTRSLTEKLVIIGP